MLGSCHERLVVRNFNILPNAADFYPLFYLEGLRRSLYLRKSLPNSVSNSRRLHRSYLLITVSSRIVRHGKKTAPKNDVRRRRKLSEKKPAEHRFEHDAGLYPSKPDYY